MPRLERDVAQNLSSVRSNGFPLEHLTPMEIAEDMLNCTKMLDDYGIDADALQLMVAAVVARQRLDVNQDKHLVS